MDKLEDDSLMPYGQHKGKQMADVPAKDLIWLYENDRCSSSVRDYIKRNIEVLKGQIAYENKKKNRN